MAGDPTIVAVLAGGSGSRLGGGKPARELRGRPLISYPLSAARNAGLEAIVVAKPDTPLPVLAERIVPEPALPRHPLCGMLAALRVARTMAGAPSVLFLACDTPFLTGELLAWLASLGGAVVTELDGLPQPLPLRCPGEHIGLIERASRELVPLRATAAALSPRVVREDELARFGEPATLLFNVNGPEDLGRAGALWQESAGAARGRPTRP